MQSIKCTNKCSVQWLDKLLNPCNYHHNEDIQYFHHPRKFPHAFAKPISTSSLQRQPLSNLLHQRLVLTFLVVYIHWIVQCALFVSGFFHPKSCLLDASVLLHLSVSLFSIAKEYSITQLHVSLFICAPVDGHLGWPPVWGIINKVAMNEWSCTSQFVDLCFHVFSVNT